MEAEISGGSLTQPYPHSYVFGGGMKVRQWATLYMEEPGVENRTRDQHSKTLRVSSGGMISGMLEPKFGNP